MAKENMLTRWMPFRLRNQIKRLLQMSNSLLTPLVIVNPSLSAKIYSYKSYANEFVILDPDLDTVEKDENGLPVPPKVLRLGELTKEAFLSRGKSDVESMIKCLNTAGVSIEDSSTILDYGCSSGKMIRWLFDYAKEREIWGVDLAAEHIFWNQRYLSPPFHFATVTSAPHLPFEDNYFDFIFAGSVFTHIDDLVDACFLELRRVLKKGGFLYVTICDNSTLEVFQANHEWPLSQVILGSKAYQHFSQSKAKGRMFTVGRSLMANVYFDREFLIRHLSRIFELKSVTSHAYGFQTGYLLRKFK